MTAPLIFETMQLAEFGENERGLVIANEPAPCGGRRREKSRAV
jgi:hypothetical protein